MNLKKLYSQMFESFPIELYITLVLADIMKLTPRFLSNTCTCICIHLFVLKYIYIYKYVLPVIYKYIIIINMI